MRTITLILILLSNSALAECYSETDYVHHSDCLERELRIDRLEHEAQERRQEEYHRHQNEMIYSHQW